jgi:hypothetical protein
VDHSASISRRQHHKRVARLRSCRRAQRFMPTPESETMTQSSLATPKAVEGGRRSVPASSEGFQIASSPSVDWRRVKGYKTACNIKRNPCWIWQHGYRLWNEDEHEFWLCRRCHHGSVKRPFPKGHIFQTTLATSAAGLHLTKQHLIDEDGAIAPTRPPSKKRRLESWASETTTRQGQSNSPLSFRMTDQLRQRGLQRKWMSGRTMMRTCEHLSISWHSTMRNLRLTNHCL